MACIFVGGIAPLEMYSKEREASKSALQNAAENFQNGFISGLVENNEEDIEVITAPFFSSWPSFHRSPYIRNAKSVDERGIKITGVGYVNFPIIKNIHKYINIRKALSLRLMDVGGGCEVIVYSLNLAYLAAVASMKKIGVPVKTGVIVTDLPQHPGDCGLMYRLYLKHIEKRLLSRFLNDIDFFVLLTEQMSTELKVDKRRCVIMEGLYDESRLMGGIADPKVRYGEKVVLYTGTLDHRYGIPRLVDAFKSISDRAVELWICGAGNSEDLVRQAAKDFPRIKFLGKKDRDEIALLQRHADLLINPRNNEGEYNRFSFPSKLMEYLASGTPTLIYKLDGIPKEYYEFLYTVEELKGETLAGAILRVLDIPETESKERALSGSDFIKNRKNARKQVGRVLDFMRDKN